MRIDPTSISSSGDTYTLWVNQTHGEARLSRWQGRLQAGRFWWLGNRVSDLRYWMWRASR